MFRDRITISVSRYVRNSCCLVLVLVLNSCPSREGLTRSYVKSRYLETGPHWGWAGSARFRIYADMGKQGNTRDELIDSWRR